MYSKKQMNEETEVILFLEVHSVLYADIMQLNNIAHVCKPQFVIQIKNIFAFIGIQLHSTILGVTAL